MIAAPRLPRLLLGATAGLLALLAAGEGFVRIAPPSDVVPYLGAQSGLSGPYVADPVLGADYRTYEAFAESYRDRLADLAAANDGRPVWAMFGNSFVQARGMLGDTAQAGLPGRQIFYLKRNEPFYLRVAQFRMLLSEGLEPERAFFVVLPIDLYGMALDPVPGIAVTPDGAIGHNLRKPPMLGSLLDHSRLLLTGWLRSGHGALLPDFEGRHVLEPLPDLVKSELDRLFGEIARIGTRHQVPVTIVFLPNREQIFGDARTIPQDAFRAAAERFGLDFLDTSSAFLAQDDRSGLLIADGHLSKRGNAILLDTILSHVGRSQPVAQIQ